MAKTKPNPLTVQAKDCYDPADYVVIHKDYYAKLTQALRDAVEQAEQGVMVEHDCPAMYACASIVADAHDRARGAGGKDA